MARTRMIEIQEEAFNSELEVIVKELLPEILDKYMQKKPLRGQLRKNIDTLITDVIKERQQIHEDNYHKGQAQLNPVLMEILRMSGAILSAIRTNNNFVSDHTAQRINEAYEKIARDLREYSKTTPPDWIIPPTPSRQGFEWLSVERRTLQDEITRCIEAIAKEHKRSTSSIWYMIRGMLKQGQLPKEV